jgi:hypothetical protein
MAHAWEALAQYEAQTGRPYHTVLRRRALEPTLRSPHLAEQLSQELGRPVTAVWVRQMLFKAQEAFVDLLISEIARGLDVPTRQQIEEELIALDLLEYCRPGLNRFGAAT